MSQHMLSILAPTPFLPRTWCGYDNGTDSVYDRGVQVLFITTERRVMSHSKPQQLESATCCPIWRRCRPCREVLTA
jgi:hypothetical protein